MRDFDQTSISTWQPNKAIKTFFSTISAPRITTDNLFSDKLPPPATVSIIHLLRTGIQ